MENLQQKAHFLKTALTEKLTQLDPHAERMWGKMNVQQMIEHMSQMFRVASGKEQHIIHTPDEHLPKMQEFLKSEKQFRENTPNKLLSDEPEPVKHADIKDAISELQSEIDDFFSAYEDAPGKTVTNPFFGNLDYDMQVQLLYKHAMHHLRQFNAA